MTPEQALNTIKRAIPYLSPQTNVNALEMVWEELTDEQKYDFLKSLPQDMKEEFAAQVNFEESN